MEYTECPRCGETDYSHYIWECSNCGCVGCANSPIFGLGESGCWLGQECPGCGRDDTYEKIGKIKRPDD